MSSSRRSGALADHAVRDVERLGCGATRESGEQILAAEEARDSDLLAEIDVLDRDSVQSRAGARIEALNRGTHGRGDQFAARHRSPGPDQAVWFRAAQEAVGSVEEVAGDADAVLDLREAAVMRCVWHRCASHQVELVAEVEEGITALLLKSSLP